MENPPEENFYSGRQIREKIQDLVSLINYVILLDEHEVFIM